MLDTHHGAANRIFSTAVMIPGAATKETGGSDPRYSHLRTVTAGCTDLVLSRSDRPYVKYVQGT